MASLDRTGNYRSITRKMYNDILSVLQFNVSGDFLYMWLLSDDLRAM